jgi:hypothetical protein
MKNLCAKRKNSVNRIEKRKKIKRANKTAASHQNAGDLSYRYRYTVENNLSTILQKDLLRGHHEIYFCRKFLQGGGEQSSPIPRCYQKEPIKNNLSTILQKDLLRGYPTDGDASFAELYYWAIP